MFLDETKVKITNKGDEKENRTINYYKNWDNDIENIVLNSVIKNNILLYLEKVKTVTNELKTEIRETNKNTINLLNI
ncbi:MAG: hypothetical protein IPF54_14310 [Draconibacterium sp.]|nr:hypothetical protein [Draconibacterium sp.]